MGGWECRLCVCVCVCACVRACVRACVGDLFLVRLIFRVKVRMALSALSQNYSCMH